MKFSLSRLLLINLCLALSVLGIAQNCTPVYNKKYGANGSDEALHILYTNDKGSIVTGRTTSGTGGDYDAFIMKLNEKGNIEWSKNYGVPQGNDEFTKIISSGDGGYLAIGQTNSFSNKNGEPLLVKLDNNGIIQWANTVIKEISASYRATDITRLSDGSFALLVNSNESLSQGDGMVLKISSAGTILWSKTFDNGDDDALNSLAQLKDSLVVMGHTTVNNFYQAVLMKLNLANGNPYQALSIRKFQTENVPGYHTDGIMVTPMLNGLAFTTTFGYDKVDKNANVTHLKMLDNGKMIYERISHVSTASGQKIITLRSKFTDDSSFIQMQSDTTDYGYPEYAVYDYAGNTRVRRSLYENTYDNTHMQGLDITGSSGYLFAGYCRDNYPVQTFKIKVVKTDKNGFVGSCTRDEGSNFVDSAHHLFANFTWQSVTPGKGTGITAVTLQTRPNAFSESLVCEDLSCDKKSTISDSCNQAFLLRFATDAYVRLFDANPTTDGGHLVAGLNGFYNTSQPFLAKLGPSGRVEWSNFYARYQSEGQFKKIISTSDNQSVVLGVNGTSLNYGYDYNSVIFKITGQGKILWNKTLTGFNVYNAIATGDGGFIAIGNYSWGSGYIYSYLVRFNSKGDITWKKQMMHNAGTPVYKGLWLEGDNLYTGADYYQGHNMFRVEKWNAATGANIWNNRYEISSTEYVYMNDVSMCGDTLVASLNLSAMMPDFSIRNTIAMVSFDTGGKLLGGFEISQPNFSNLDALNEHTPSFTASTPDNGLVVARASTANNKSGLSLFKLRTDGTVIWSRLYDKLPGYHVMSVKADGEKLLITGQVTTDSYEYKQESSFLLKTDKNGNISDTATGDCQNIPQDLTIQSLKGVSLSWNDLDSIREPVDVFINDYEQTIKPVYTSSRLACNIAGTCNKISIAGPDTICNISNLFTYSVVKNKECRAAAIWETDTSSVKIISRTDSTLKLQFLKPGRQTISALLNAGCSVLKSDKIIYVVQKAASFNLGPDTSLCPGNSIRLSAGQGFASYRWQDGSGDTSFLVKSPGTYFVAVKDGCNATSADTILVRPYGAINFSAGKDISKCNSDTVTLTATAGFINYKWQPAYHIIGNGTNSIQAFPPTDTSYTLVAEKLPGCFAYDTVRITVHHSALLSLRADTSICRGDSVLVFAGSGFSSYRWNTGAITAQIHAASAGDYSVEATDNHGCKSADAFQLTSVYDLPLLQFGRDLGICSGDSIQLDAGAAMKNYQWSSGETSRYLQVHTTGNYGVRVTDSHNCVATDTAVITRMLPLPSDFLPKDTTLCSYATLPISTQSAFEKYAWSTGQQNRSITISNAGIYWLDVTGSNGCTGRDTIRIAPLQCMEGVFIPSAFTPNADGKNDLFKPIVYGKPLEYYFAVYNRFGQLIFSTQTPGDGWNGKYQGIDQHGEVYAWRCTYQLEGDTKKTEKGTVMLIR